MGDLQGFEDVEINAVCDPVAEARDAAAEQFGAKRLFAAVEDLLDGGGLDAVFVTTPPYLNAPVALRCLRRGMDTFVEKPPGMSVAETTALRDAAAATGARGMVGWNRRLNPMIVRAEEMVRERGPVVQLVGEFHKSLTRFEEDGLYGEDFLDHMMWESINHSVDIVRAMARSEVAEVHSVVRRALHNYKDVFGALVLFANGCLAHLVFNWTSGGRLERYEIHGRDISAYLEGVDHGVVQCDGRRHELENSGNGAKEEERYFIDCVKEDRPIELPACNLDEAVKTMELAEAILQGLRD
jgi:predicted dehydrogenase